MALTISVQFPVTLSSPARTVISHSGSTPRLQPAVVNSYSPLLPRPRAFTIASTKKRKQLLVGVKAVDESQGRSESEMVSSEQSAADEPEQGNQPAERKVELSELGSEIKKAMEQRKAEKDGDLLGGVTEEIREIEWPGFGKVLGTTWVVLGVIAGSSVVLLTLNAVLAELSDRVFAGRGVQDFF